MGTDLLGQTGDASKSHCTVLRNGGDSLLERLPLHVQRSQLPKGIQAQDVGIEVLLMGGGGGERHSKTNKQTVTDSAEFRYSLGSQGNRNATGRWLRIPGIKEYQMQEAHGGMVSSVPVGHGM